MEAVKQNKQYLKYASEELQNSLILVKASEEILNDSIAVKSTNDNVVKEESILDRIGSVLKSLRKPNSNNNDFKIK